jgi:hypothetical protein
MLERLHSLADGIGDLFQEPQASSLASEDDDELKELLHRGESK